MSFRKVALLLFILGFGAVVETSYAVRNHVSFGPMGCRVLAGRFYGPSFTFQAEEKWPAPAGTAVEIEGNDAGRGHSSPQSTDQLTA